MKKKSKKAKLPIESAARALNTAEDKLYKAQGLIEDALSFIETGFVLITHGLPPKDTKKVKKRDDLDR